MTRRAKVEVLDLLSARGTHLGPEVLKAVVMRVLYSVI
jgi:hypothetical protein